MPARSLRPDRAEPSGEAARRLECDSLTLCEFELAPGFASRAHQHGVEAWVLGAEGALALPTRRAAPTITSGDFLRLPEDLEHRELVGPRGARCFLLRPGAALGARLRRADTYAHKVHSPELGELARRLTRLARDEDPLARLEAEGAALMVLALGCRLARSRPRANAPWLARVRAALDDEPRTPWTHARLAAIAGVTPEHLARQFRRSFGCTLATYLRRRRLARAQRLLRETRASLSAIAQATGFADHSHFTRSFRAVFGVTPSEYRR